MPIAPTLAGKPWPMNSPPASDTSTAGVPKLLSSPINETQIDAHNLVHCVSTIWFTAYVAGCLAGNRCCGLLCLAFTCVACKVRRHPLDDLSAAFSMLHRPA
eukprot:5448067-Amphidinium_carterae.5